MAPLAAEDGVRPVFILTKDLPPDHDRPFSTREICAKAEDLTGYDTIDGAQRIGGLWRLYPKTREARLRLVVQGMAIRNIHVRLHDENPFLAGLSGENRGEIETTKLFISNIPISFSNLEIEKALHNLGCSLVSKLIDECDRDDKGKLTRWKTGRRFAFIAIPKEPLPKQVPVGMFTARLYHREQNLATSVICGNCLAKGHRKGDCQVPVVCKRCKGSGHKAGEMLCGASIPHGEPRRNGPMAEVNKAGEATPSRQQSTNGRRLVQNGEDGDSDVNPKGDKSLESDDTEGSSNKRKQPEKVEESPENSPSERDSKVPRERSVSPAPDPEAETENGGS